MCIRQHIGRSQLHAANLAGHRAVCRQTVGLLVPQCQLQLRVFGRHVGQVRAKSLYRRAAARVQELHRARLGSLQQRVQHGHHRGNADAGADQHHRRGGSGIQPEITHRRRHVDQRALLYRIVQHIGHHAGRTIRRGGFALDGNTQGAATRGTRQAVLARLHDTQLRHRYAHGNVLARQPRRQAAAIGRLQVKRRDLAAFRHLAHHTAGAPAAPAPSLRGSLLVQRCLFGNQQVGQLAVSCTPGGQQGLIGRVAQHFGNGRQQVAANYGVMLGTNTQAGVLVGHQRQHRRQHRRVVDMLGVGRHRHRQRLLLATGLLVSLVKDLLQLWVVPEHAGIKVAGKRDTMGFEYRCGGFDELAGGLIQHGGSNR
jgi:hypothetical protein